MKSTCTPLWRRVLASVTLLTLLFTFAPPVEIVRAATFAIANVAGASQVLGASTASAAALKITFSSTEATQTLTSVKVTLADEDNSGITWSSGAATSSDLANLVTGDASGIALYKDDTSNGTAGTFDAEDDVVTLTSTPVYASATTFILNPASDPTLADGDIYFVVFKPKASPTEWHRFRASIAAQDDIVTSGTNPTIAAAVQSNVITLDAVPTINSTFAQPWDATKVMIFFSDPVTVASSTCADAGACASIYTVSGSIAVNSAVSMAGSGATSTDAVELTLASAATNGTNTVTPAASTVLDDEGNAVANSAITMELDFPPIVTGIKSVNGTTVDVTFDQAMLAASTDVTARYTLTTTAVDTETVSSATLQGDTKTVRIVASGATIADGDQLQINNIGLITNPDGVSAVGNEFFQIDGTLPTVNGLVKNVGATIIWLKFSEALDIVTSEITTNYVDTGGSAANPTSAELLWYEPSTAPSWMTSQMSNKVVKLTFASEATGTITVTNVKDMAGNVISGSNTAAISAGSAVAIATAGVSADMTQGKHNSYLEGCTDDFGNTGLTCNDNASSNNRDSIVIPFTGSIDAAYLGENSSGIIPNIGTFVEIYSSWTYSGAASSDCSSGDVWGATTHQGGAGCLGKNYANLDQSYGVLSDNSGTDNLLTIYLSGQVNVWDGMEVNPFGVKGLNGLTAIQHATASKNIIPMPVWAEVEFVKSTRAGASFANADTVTLFFNADMTQTDVDVVGELTKIVPQTMMPWAQHSWGSGGALAVAWGNHDGTTCTLGANNGSPDCLKITLGSSPTVVDGDELMIMGLNSLAGMPIGWGGTVDVSAPTLTKNTWNTTANTLLLQYNEELVDQSGDELTTHGIGFTDQNGGGVTISSVATVTDCMAGDMWCPFKKILITFSGDIEDDDDLNFASANLVDEGGYKIPNITNMTVSSLTDADPPTIYKAIQNDWNGDGSLNAWDEVILVFDGDPAAGLQASDVDYATITNVNTDFIVKRDGTPVSNPFGTGVNFWIDQWDIHTGELHINLGQGADIQAGDEFWAAASEVADGAGNYMQSASAQLTLTSVESGEISKIVYADNGSAGTVDNADTFAVTFNTAIDPTSCGTYTAGGSPEVANLDWCLPIEHNFDMGGAYTFAAKTWGSATGAWDAGFTTLTITLAGGDVSLADGDRIQTWSIVTAAGGRVNKPGEIDTSKPVLSSVKGNKTLGASASAWDAGDKLTLTFSEPMAEASLRVDSVANAMTDTGIADGNFGSEATFSWLDPEKRIFEVTLGSSGLDIDTDGAGGDDTDFDPAATVTDLNGNADLTVATVDITLSSMTAASALSVSDADTTYSGIDGRDLTVTWTTSGADKYLIYVLPEFVRFDAGTHNPVGIATTSPWTGPSTLMVDSRSMDSTAAYDPNQPYFPLNDWDNYDVFVVASNTGETDLASPAKSGSVLRFTMEYGSDGQAPWVDGSMPWDGAKDIALNSKNFSVKFNEAMARSTIEASGNIVLEQKSGTTWTSPTNVPIYTSYDETNFAATIEPQSTLTLNSNYRIRVTTNITDMGGTALSSEYTTHFNTSNTTDSTGPKVKTYFINGGTTTTDIPRNIFSLSIEFNEDMDASTFTSTGVTLSPNVPGSDIWYDPMMRSLNYVLGGSLAQNTTYTLTLSGVYLKDTAGNTLDGDGNATAAGTTLDNYELTFTTVNTSLSTTKPLINWIDSDSRTLWAGFDSNMDKATVEKKSNWTLKEGSTVVSLQTATFFYDGFMNELRIEGLSLNTNAHTLTPNTSVLAMNNQEINTGSSNLSFTPWSDSAVFNSGTIDTMATGFGMAGTFNGDMFAKMGDADVAMDKDIKMFMPISAWPMNQTAGKSTSYHINFPTSNAIPNGGKILLEFPSSFDVTNAALAKDDLNTLFFFNQDINGPGGTMTAGSTFDQDGKVQITDVSANNQTKTITLTLAVDDGTGCALDKSGDDETPVTTGSQNAADNSIYGEFKSTCTDTNQTSTTMAYDFLDFELSGIVNGNAADVDWFNDTGGYQVEITTKNASNKKLEGPIKSMKFDIKEAGNGAISGTIKAPSGAAVASAKIFLDSPMAGHLETTSAADGTYSFSGLPVAASSNAWDGWYDVWAEAPKANDDYFGGQGFHIQLTNSAPTSTGNDATLNSAANTITFTITNGAALYSKDVSIWASGQNGWKEKKVTLDADGSTTATMKVSDGTWDFGINPYFEMTAFGGGHMETDFMPPKPEQKNITGDDTITIALSSADNEITGTVKDNSGSGLSSVHVYAYDPSGTGQGGGTETTTDGSYTLKVGTGTYTIGAFKPGLPSVPEQTVEIASGGAITQNGSIVTSLNFTMQKSGSSISGSVSDGTNAIQYAGVNAWTSDGKYAWSNTDAQGSYTLFVEPGTWNIDVFAPGYGKIDPASGVDVTDVVVATDAEVTGKNFSLSGGTFYTISGQVKDGSNNGVANIFVNVDEVNYAGSIAGNMTGMGNSVKTDSSGNFSISVKANTSGTSASSTRYVLSAWNSEYSDIKPDSTTPVDVSSASSTGNDFTVDTKRTMTISIINGDDMEVTGVDINEVFVDIYSLSENIGNHKRLKNINLTAGDNTSAGTISLLDAGGYKATMHIPGIGEFSGTKGGSASFSVSADATIQFDLALDSGTSTITLDGTVSDALAAVVGDAWVSATNTSTYETFGESSAADGTYSFKVPAGTYTLRVDKPSYKSPTEISVSATDSARALTITKVDSSISGTVYASDGTTAVDGAYVWAEEVDGGGWAGVETSADGTYSLPVPSGTDWKIYSQDDQGNVGSITQSTAADSSSKTVTLATTLAGAAYIADQPKVASITPSDGGVIDDSDNTGVKIIIPPSALGTGENPGTITIKETASLPSSTQVAPFGGIGKEIVAVDSNGNAITTLNSDITVELTYTKTEVEAFAAADADAASNGLEELDELQNSYRDGTTNTWNSLNNSTTVKVKNDSTDATWTAIDFDTFVANVAGEGDNSGNGGGVGKDYYDDYKIINSITTDHFTIFGTTTPTDAVAPATPTGLATTASDGSVSLDWSDNSEGDLLEYQVFRGTASGLTCNDASQINTSAVTPSAYTDSSPTASTSYSYYYKITAVDTSGNISTCSSAVVADYTYSGGGSSSGGGGGGGGSSIDLTTPYKLPTTESSSTTSIYRPLELSQTEGVLVRPVKLYSYYKKTLTVEIPQSTKVTTADGVAYIGSIEAPKTYTAGPTESGTGVTTHAVLTVGSSSQYLNFDKPVKLTIPITLDDSADISKIKVFYYDSATTSYKLAGDGGTVSNDKTKIVVEVDHFTTFVVFETDATSVAAEGETTSAAATTTSLTDISNQWFTAFVDKLVGWGAVAGYPDGTYRPANPANRAEMAKIIAEAFDLTIPTSLAADPFPDVSKDAWFAPYVAALKDAGVVGGYTDGTFRPANSINRAEALKMAVNAAGHATTTATEDPFSDVSKDAWFAPFVAACKDKGVVSGSPVKTFEAAEGAELYTPAFANYYSLGSTGEGVKNLKLVLQQLGHFSGVVDENFDEAASAAIKAYQSSVGIGAVGSFGPITRTSLNYKIATQGIQIPKEGDMVEKTIYLFRPADPVNRAEIAKIVVNAKENF
jgi:hypothetical protein